VTQPSRGGYLAFQGSQDWYDGRYPSSSLNFVAGQTAAAMVITSADSFLVHNGSSGSTHAVVDLSGYFLP